MQLETRKLLYDAQQAAALVDEFTRGRGLAEYREDAMLRSAVERQLEIIGEALNRLSQSDPSTAERITEHRRNNLAEPAGLAGSKRERVEAGLGLLEVRLPVGLNRFEPSPGNVARGVTANASSP